MTGEPGKKVEGGWTFTNGDGSFELVYKADEGGFQPQAKHIPVPVEDTDEVVEAKRQFYSLYEEAKAEVKAANAEKEEEEEPSGVVDYRRKRDAAFRPPFRPRFHFNKKPDKDAQYTFDPFYGFVPVDAKEGDKMADMEETLYKFVPYKGFMAADPADDESNLFKFVPFKGFVPAKEAAA